MLCQGAAGGGSDESRQTAIELSEQALASVEPVERQLGLKLRGIRHDEVGAFRDADVRIVVRVGHVAERFLNALRRCSAEVSPQWIELAAQKRRIRPGPRH